MLTFAAAREGVWGRQITWSDTFQVLFILVGEQKVKWSVVWPLLAIPAPIYRWLRERHWKQRSRLTGELPPDKASYDRMRL